MIIVLIGLACLAFTPLFKRLKCNVKNNADSASGVARDVEWKF